MLTRNEFYRQVLHIGAGVGVALAYYGDLLSPLAVFLGIVVGGLASLLSKRVKLPGFSWFLQHFEREEMRTTFPGRGLIFFFIGVLLCMQLFPKDIALASIMILALGDSFSHILGEALGTMNNFFNWKSRKLFEGTLAGFFFAFLGAFIFVPLPEAFVASFFAMVAEVIDIDFNGKHLDDNLIVPLVAGTVMLLMRVYLGY
jgi:dolichol kinase